MSSNLTGNEVERLVIKVFSKFPHIEITSEVVNLWKHTVFTDVDLYEARAVVDELVRTHQSPPAPVDFANVLRRRRRTHNPADGNPGFEGPTPEGKAWIEKIRNNLKNQQHESESA
jgi:hypothetical protein